MPSKNLTTESGTLIVNNFRAQLTRYNFGDINSGFAKWTQTNGVDAFSQPGCITWQEAPVQIDSSYSVLTDLIVAAKERVESGVSYVYAIGHTGRLYKIQVNDPATFNPDYDNPVLLATLSAQSPTFTRGGFIEFFGSTERIYIGHDKGVTRIDFNGTNETFIGSTSSWTQTVPRPLKQFVGKLYVGNGSNIAEIDTTNTVTTYTKLSPGFPDNTQVRDLDVTPDGNYLSIVVSRLALGDITSASVDTGSISNSDSYIFQWNGTDTGYTSYTTYSSYSLTANTVFGSHQYAFGVDPTGSAVYQGTEKALSLPTAYSPMPNAIGTGSNMVGWLTTELNPNTGFQRGGQFLYGVTDNDFGLCYLRQFSFNASGTETDVIRTPVALLVSSFSLGSPTNGYTAGIFGFGKGYFSSLETSNAPTTKYKFYKWYPITTTLGTPVQGIYETQSQQFSKKVTVNEVRVYGTGINPGGINSTGWIANNSFKIDLIGVDGNPITNGSYTFTAGSTLTVGNDYAWYNPNIKPTGFIGLRVTNLGTSNYLISRVEIDWSEAGK